MDAIITNHHSTSFSFAKSRKDRADFKRNVKFCENPTEEVMYISKVEPVRIIGRPNLEEN